jgi:aminopeptidase-like protein
MKDGEYHVVIDSTLEPGAISLAEALLEGESDDEVLISSYLCHPSMANNELSGPILSVMLYNYLSKLPKLKHTYRFYFGAETIGALVYLQMRGNHFKEKMKAGLVVTCCGDNGKFNYKKVKRDDNLLDKPVLHSLKHSDIEYKIRDFFPSGSDERQYCSPGFNLPVGSIMRSVYGEFPEYHTSLDDLEFVNSKQLLETLNVYVNALFAFDNNKYYLNKKPYGEPFFSKYGLYPTLGGKKDHPKKNSIMKYILSFADGNHDLIEIADKLDLPIWDLIPVIDQLCDSDLLQIENN